MFHNFDLLFTQNIGITISVSIAAGRKDTIMFMLIYTTER